MKLRELLIESVEVVVEKHSLLGWNDLSEESQRMFKEDLADSFEETVFAWLKEVWS